MLKLIREVAATLHHLLKEVGDAVRRVAK